MHWQGQRHSGWCVALWRAGGTEFLGLLSGKCQASVKHYWVVIDAKRLMLANAVHYHTESLHVELLVGLHVLDRVEQIHAIPGIGELQDAFGVHGWRATSPECVPISKQWCTKQNMKCEHVVQGRWRETEDGQLKERARCTAVACSL